MMSSDPNSFHKMLGWSPIGEECRGYLINIGTRTFSSIAIVCALGFVSWQIYEGKIMLLKLKITNISTSILYLDTLSEEHFTSFLDERVRLMLPASAVGVFDNAAIHHSLGSRLMLEDVFTNLYYFLPVYSPHLNPNCPATIVIIEF